MTPSRAPSRGRVKRLALSLFVAALLLAALALWGGISAEELAQTLASLSGGVFLSAISVHAGIYLLRALRFRQLLPPQYRPRLTQVLSVSSAHNLAAYVLPAKTGEASFVLYLRAACGVPAAEGLASLLISRLLDLATLIGGVALACLAIWLGPMREGREWLLPLGASLLGLAVALSLLCLRPHALLHLVLAVSRMLGIARTRIGMRVHAKTEEVARALRQAGAGGRLFGGALISIVLWAGVFLFYAILARGFGMGANLTLPEAAFGSGLSTLANLLPINGFAGFGTQEAGWVVGFGMLGVPRELALSTGIATHLVQLFDVVLFGMLGHLAMGAVANASRRAADPSSPAGSQRSRDDH